MHHIQVDEIEKSLASPVQILNKTPRAEGEARLTELNRARIVGEAIEDRPGLVNRKLPFYQNKTEKPVHRLMLELSAAGWTNKEIAQQLEVTPVCVSNILRQPMLQSVLVNTIREKVSADQEVVEIIRRNVVAAAKLYESVLNDPAAERKDRMEAAERFMNRRYGKPNQPINKGTDVDLNKLSDSELAKMLPATNGTGNT